MWALGAGAAGALTLAAWVWASNASVARARTAGTGEDGAARMHGSAGAIDAAGGALRAAEEYAKRGELGTARTILEAGIGKFPDDQAMRLSLARVLVQVGERARAYEQFEAALAIGPREGELEFQAGVLAAGLGRDDRAIEHFGAAQATDPGRAEYPLYLGLSQVRLGDAGAARKNLMLAARLDESLATAWGSLAELSLRENEARVALQMIERARELEPDVTAWRVIEARALKRVGEVEGALMVLMGIPEAERGAGAVLRLIGECYGALGRPGDAAATYASFAARNPDNGELLFETAQWFERAGDRVRATEFAERAAALGFEGAGALAERLLSQE